MINSEAKKIIRKTITLCKILFSLGEEKYNFLLDITDKIKLPTNKELNEYIKDNMTLEEAFIIELKERYKSTAVSHGFEEKHGLAVIEYAALLEDIKE